jgi:hypothetical protein
VVPPALAAEPTHCTATHAVHKADAPARSATPKGGYVVAARMGWAAG